MTSIGKSLTKSIQQKKQPAHRKMKPSEIANQLVVDVNVEDYPMIVDFVNIQDNSSQVHSSVDVDRPLFQPSPSVVIFEGYAPFATHEKKLYFRNNDKVPRRIKIPQPDSPFFEILAPRSANGEPLQQNKIAAGMEIYFTIKFKPQEVRDYALDLICVTEREKFLVPVRALGNRPNLNFPDDINFGQCPVKSTARKMILVQNLGLNSSKFHMTSNNSGFSCASDEYCIEPGQSHMIEIFFTPTSAIEMSGEIEIEYSKILKCYISLKGSGKNVEVALSTPSLTLESAYITLSSQKTLRINNFSDIPINFAWKSYLQTDEEELERQRLLSEINRMERMEQAALAEGIETFDEDLDNYGMGEMDDSEGSLSGEEEGTSHKIRAAKASLVRKYRNLRRALERDPMHFVDDIFEITPCEGLIYPKSEIEITCKFRPDTAAHYTCMAYLDVSGREDRLPLSLTGLGIGPHASLSFDILDLGDVFINSEQAFDLTITNKGDISAQWAYISSLTKFGNKFSFTPREGLLEVGQSTGIKLRFCSDILGEFSEYFRFGLQGNEEPLIALVRGNVIGPTFHFDVKTIDFGAVSFDYLHSRTIRMVNTSKISMTYTLHIPQDVKKEFEVTPSAGTLEPHSYQDIQIEFIPNTVKVYSYILAVDVKGVGDTLLSIPITAECFAASLRLQEKDIKYGDCFIRYPYQRDIIVVNTSDIVHTTFKVIPQQQYTKNIATYDAFPSTGVVAPGDKMSIRVTLTPEKLGNFKVPILISVAGSQEPPFQAALVCTAIGPRVMLDQSEIRWGNTECLKDFPRVLKVTNDSLISASMKFFLKTMRSKFDLSVREITLEPGKVLDLVITANLDDTVVHNDELHISVHEGDHLIIPLSARGIGTTMFCNHDIQTIDFGVQLTTTVFERRITLENKGRRHQALKWTNWTIKDENNARLAKLKKLGNAQGLRLPKDLMPLEPKFSVTPVEITLRPRTAVVFIFRGSCSTVGHISETFVLESRTGKERNMRQIMTANVQCEIVDPLIQFSVPELSYVYKWEKEEKNRPIFKQDVTLTNKSAVTLQFVLKTDIPFNLNAWEHTLTPGQSVDVSVEFLPFYRDDKVSHSVEKSLSVTYRGHPQKDNIPLKGEVIYPNLEFETANINFGCILNDNSKIVRCKATNTSKVAVAYEWFFLEDDGKAPPRPKKKNQNAIATPHVFDILPIKSVLEPGAFEDIEFVMYGHENAKYSGQAVCVVEGGPEYIVQLKGEASTVSYSLDKSIIDFGLIIYNERRDEELVISNQGLVAFPFEATTENPSSSGIIDVLPSSGKVPPGEKVKLTVRLRPWQPESLAECIVVKVAHFDPVKIMCYAQGTFPAIVATLPRDKQLGPFGETENVDDAWNQVYNDARVAVEYPDQAKRPPKSTLVPPPASETTAVPPVYISSTAPLTSAALNDKFAMEVLDETSSQSSEGRVRSVKTTTRKGPSQIQLEVEVQRRSLCFHLSNKVNEILNKPSTAATANTRTITTAATGVTKKENSSIQGLLKNLDMQTITMAAYLCDFGNIILNTSKKRLFKIANPSTAGPIGWVFDKRLLSGTGFIIEPEKVSRLPEGGSVDFLVKFIAEPKTTLGKRIITLPLLVKGAPRVNVILSANVCIPEVDASSHALDFEQIYLGCTKKMYFFLINKSPVTANWRIVRSGVTSKDNASFLLDQDRGSIEAGKKIVIGVEFLPTDPRRYQANWTLKVDMSTITKSIQMVGEGLAPQIRFEPPLLQLGPVLPFSQGSENLLTIHNDSGQSFEIFSQDFDPQYKEEYNILSTVDIYDSDGFYRSTLRNAGEALPVFIMDAFKKATQPPSVTDGVSLEADQQGNMEVLPEAPLRRDGAPRDNNQHQDILVIGPPLSGVTTQATALATKLQLPLRTIDDLVHDVASVSGAYGLKARVLLGRMTAEEIVTRKQKEDELLAAAEKSKTDVMDAFKKDKKNKKNAEIPAELLQTPQVHTYQSFLEETRWTTAAVADILKYRLSWEDAGYGVVIDSIYSQYVEIETVVPAIKTAMPRIIIAKINLHGDEAGYVAHISYLHSIYSSRVDHLAAIAKERRLEEERSQLLSRQSTASNKERRRSVSSNSPERRKSLNETNNRNPSTTTPPVEAPKVIPRKQLMGDEFWYDVKTELVAELDKDEISALEEDQKDLYQQMLQAQQAKQLDEATKMVKKIEDIWTPQKGLKKPSESRQGSPNKKPVESTFKYPKYIARVVPLIQLLFAAETEIDHGFDQHSTISEDDRSLYSRGGVGGGANSTASLPMTPGTIPQGDHANDDHHSVSLGSPSQTVTGEIRDYGIYIIEFEPEDSIDEVFTLLNAILPAPKVPPPDKDSLPLPKTCQVVRKPLTSIERPPITKFELLSAEDRSKSIVATPVTASAPASKGQPRTSQKKTPSKNAPVVEVAPPPVEKPKYRWVIPPFGSVSFKIHFSSNSEGTFESMMGFEATGTYQTYSLPCIGICEVPQIQNDPRNTFMRRIKSVPPGATVPQHRFVMSDNYFSFGPLLSFKQAIWRLPLPDETQLTVEDKLHREIIQQNVEVIRLTNTGRYKCQVDLGFENDGDDVKDVFYVEPSSVELEEGETCDCKIWAFPGMNKEYRNNLVACVSNNPKPVVFELRCCGVEPGMEFYGPWTEAIQSLQDEITTKKSDKHPDAKKIKEMEAKLQHLLDTPVMDFDRMLCSKEDSRTFEIKNISLLPISWEIDPEDFLESENVTVFPLSGVISAGASATITISVTSPIALLINGKFTFKYSDNEGGLQTKERLKQKTFRVVAEVYSIQAVSLTANGSEEGGNEVDFGIMRVGDLVSRSIRMGNKGKYQIGYRVSFKKASTGALITIDPLQGLIEPGADMLITCNICAKQGELKMKGNKDIRVSIFEPVTGEVVEEFPLLVSAQARFNRFRMQPAKGLSFGAVRFDSEIKKKTIELRNESQFEITFVATAAISEHNELDTLDANALTCFAFNTPAALRASILGEGYMDRLLPAGKGAPPPTRPSSKQNEKRKASGKPSITPTTGKGTAKLDPASLVPEGPVTTDPDHLLSVPPPKDPLTVGAFTLFPRVGYIQPGENITIDISFNPAGISTAKERLKFFISGADFDDIPAKTIQNFEVNGDSCFPAIVTDDIKSIFEEQEIINSLSDIINNSSNDGGTGDVQTIAKIDRVRVGKVVYVESDKGLVFGPVVCNPNSGKGIMERIKITNPTKIDTKVRFKILPGDLLSVDSSAMGANSKGKKPATDKRKASYSEAPSVETPAFTVQPEIWDIPPHEHRYVNIFFSPTEIKSYRGIFRAEVDDSTASNHHHVDKTANPGGKLLQFDLAGSGTMPCVTVETPNERDDQGNLLLDFGKIHIMKSSKRVITIRNHGVMPSTCLFDVNGDNDFVFSSKGSSVTLQPGEKQDLLINFSPTVISENSGPNQNRAAVIKLSVLNNPFDHYSFKLKGQTYACDAFFDIPSTSSAPGPRMDSTSVNTLPSADIDDRVIFEDINLLSGITSSQRTVVLRSRSDYNLKFEMKCDSNLQSIFSFSPTIGHLGARGSKEITITFKANTETKLDNAKISCLLRRIEYIDGPHSNNNSDPDTNGASTRGNWDDSMKSIRPATEEDYRRMEADEKAIQEYNKKLTETKPAKGGNKKVKSVSEVLEPPVLSGLSLFPQSSGSTPMVCETALEPTNAFIPNMEPQTVTALCTAIADNAKFKCEIANNQIPFRPTYLFQSTVFSFPFVNESNIALPIKWTFDNIKRRTSTRVGTTQSGARSVSSRAATANILPSNVPCPYTIEPEETTVPPMSTQSFVVKFMPLEVDDFAYLLRGETIVSANIPETDDPGSMSGPLKFFVRGVSKRPICHFHIVDTPDYLTRRPLNMKNENGVNSPIETSDIRVVELQSTGLRTRNTFRFYVINPTSENYEFLWESIGDPNPAWRCVLSAGMLFSGKRVEMIFEYLPDELGIAESFYKFKLVGIGLEQVFLFAGSVLEPKVSFSTSKLDFHSVMLGGEGSTETIYLENQEHLMFNFSFDKTSLAQLESSTSTPILNISPKSGSVAPHGRCPITLTFKPQEELVYNFNINCEVKRKPKKLTLNVKGEGYAVHPLIRIEQDTSSPSASGNDGAGPSFLTLRPSPAVNYLDYGSVQVLDSVSKKMTVANAGKYNFDYIWDTESMGGSIALSGGKTAGTLQKGGELSYNITFAPQREMSLDGAMLAFTVAGKYTYNIIARGVGVKPALRFGFMNYDFGTCFITSPGGSTVVEETTLHITNHDPSANISVECTFQKTRALWAECPPTVLEPGQTVGVPIRFAPREVIDYAFTLPFVVNGTSKVNVAVVGRGIHARVELVNQTQRRINFGLVNVNSEVKKVVQIVNRSKKALPIQILEEGGFGSGALQNKCITYAPANEFIIQPKESVPIQILFYPNRRIPQFTEDLSVAFAGVVRKIITVSGKAQGAEVSLDADAIAFGTVVLDSEKTKKLRLDNTGDLGISYEWVQTSFGPFFNITPVSGKIGPGTEVTFDVTFRPQCVDADIRQEKMTLLVSGMPPLALTCSGACVAQPSDSVQVLKFVSLARKAQDKVVKLSNPTDRDWYVSPTIDNMNWNCVNEIKVPARGSTDLVVTYLPLTMAEKPHHETTKAEKSEKPHKGKTASSGTAVDYHDDGTTGHRGKMFIALPDGTAVLYNLVGYAGPPELSGLISLETPAKKPANFSLKLNNWLSELQTFQIQIDITEKPSPATFIIAPSSVEVAPNGIKEFHARFSSFSEGITKATLTFTNPVTREYCYYSLMARATTSEVLEVINIEAPVRQTARFVLSADNPLPATARVTMGSPTKPDEWWSCDSNAVRLNELNPFTGNSEGTFEIEYRPLQPTRHPKEHLLTIMSKDLGTFKYKLVATATAPTLRHMLRFEVPLGSTQTENFLFRTYNATSTVFTCAMKQTDSFTLTKTLTVEAAKDAWDGQDVKLPVTFEPTKIGEINDILTVNSNDMGEYVCEVIGVCTAPLPQGPFNFTEGSTMEIPFRNCFPTNCKWVFSIDSPYFKLVTASAMVNAKTKGVCTIVFEPSGEAFTAPGGIIAAKLFIRCDAKSDVPPWVFYLRGRVDPNRSSSDAPVADTASKTAKAKK